MTLPHPWSLQVFTEGKHVQQQDHQKGDTDLAWTSAELLWTVTAHDTSPKATMEKYAYHW